MLDLVRDSFGKAVGCRDGCPAADLEANWAASFGHSGDVSESGKALRRRNSQELQLARAIQRPGGGAGAKGEVDFSGGHAGIKLSSLF